MVAENYSKQRRDMAKKIGLGQKGRNARGTAAAADTPKRGGGSRQQQEAHYWRRGLRQPMDLANPDRNLSRPHGSDCEPSRTPKAGFPRSFLPVSPHRSIITPPKTQTPQRP